MPDVRKLDDLVVLSGVLGRITVSGRHFDVVEPCLREWIRFSRDFQTIAVSFLVGATAGVEPPVVALTLLRLPFQFWIDAKTCVAFCLRSEKTGRKPTAAWVGRHVRPCEAFAILRTVTNGTTSGDIIDHATRAFLDLPANDVSKNNRDRDWDWINTFDLLANEYGWSRDTIMALTMTQVGRCVDAIAARYKRQNPDGENTATGDLRNAGSRTGSINTADPTWGITKRGADSRTWDDVPAHVTATIKACGYDSVLDFHRKGVEKFLKIETAARNAENRGV